MSQTNILFLINESKDKDLTISKEIISFLLSHNVKIYVENNIFPKIDHTYPYDNERIDFALILGGDGTLLNFAHKYQNHDFPFFGIKIGRVGCLFDSNLDNYKERINLLLQRKYHIEERNVIDFEIYSQGKLKNKLLAFNEVSLHRASFNKMLLINMNVNNKNNTSFYADGLIVATSTGSSAYNLSCGGPLLLPSAKNFVVTPISPQLRLITSLIVNDTDTISINLENKKDNIDENEYHPIVAIDGTYHFDFDLNSKLVINKSDKKLKIIKITSDNSLFEPVFKISSSSSELFTEK